ncbi:hypothetical protein ABPG77_009486 [Micractinium sp. CCAP 211/92]
MRLLLVAALLAVATAAPAFDRGQLAMLRPDGEQLQHSPCEYCQDVVRTLEEFVTDPQTQATVSTFLQGSVCSSLPADFAQMCKQEVPVLVSAAAAEIAGALTPSDVCGLFGVCPNAVAALGLPAMQGPFDCPFCKLAVETFIARIEDPQRRAQIEQDMRDACSNLDAEAKARCLQDVADLFRALDNLLHDVDPEGVCEVAEFCSQHDSIEGTEAGRRGRASAAKLAHALRALATGGPAASGASNDLCQNCKTIVLEAAAILQDPKTQAELLDYAKQGCSIFQDFKAQCEQYVILYGPLVFNMAISYLQPDSLCASLGYCKPEGAPFLAA